MEAASISGTKVRPKDVFQMLVGALSLAFPVATAEEIWILGAELSAGRLIALQGTSMIIIGFFVFHAYHGHGGRTDWPSFLKRVGAIYGLTLAAAAGLLVLVDKFPWDEFGVAIGRTVVVAFPASFAATIVDSLDIKGTG